MNDKVVIMGGKLTIDKRLFKRIKPETLVLDINIKTRNPRALIL